MSIPISWRIGRQEISARSRCPILSSRRSPSAPPWIHLAPPRAADRGKQMANEPMAHQKNHPYHIIDPSPWPFLGALSGIVMLSGGILWMKGITPWVFALGVACTFYVMYV